MILRFIKKKICKARNETESNRDPTVFLLDVLIFPSLFLFSGYGIIVPQRCGPTLLSLTAIELVRLTLTGPTPQLCAVVLLYAVLVDTTVTKRRYQEINNFLTNADPGQ